MRPNAGSATVNDSWNSDCASANRSGSYARFYIFSLSRSADVQIDLTSKLDTYLFLLSGNGARGSVIASDDDGAGGANSRVTKTLLAGTYTIEATTYTASQTGIFTLTLTGTGFAAPTPTPTPTATHTPTPTATATPTTPPVSGCSVRPLRPNAGSATVNGSWSSDCASANRSGSYARFYSFSLSRSADVQIDLTSKLDTYLYLLSGNGASGAALAFNDDFGGANSRITKTLLAGTYTIEATTYAASQTGSFTLTLTDAGVVAPTPTPTPTSTHTPTAAPSFVATTWSTSLDSEQERDEYGYEERDFGDIDEDDFQLGGRSYDIEYIKWDDSSEEIEFAMDRCLKPSEFVSLQIGSRIYSSPDRVSERDSDCESDRLQDQEFEFDENSNPLRAGRSYRIILKLKAQS